MRYTTIALLAAAAVGLAACGDSQIDKETNQLAKDLVAKVDNQSKQISALEKKLDDVDKKVGDVGGKVDGIIVAVSAQGKHIVSIEKDLALVNAQLKAIHDIVKQVARGATLDLAGGSCGTLTMPGGAAGPLQKTCADNLCRAAGYSSATKFTGTENLIEAGKGSGVYGIGVTNVTCAGLL